MKVRYILLLMFGAMTITAVGIAVGYYLYQDEQTAKTEETVATSSGQSSSLGVSDGNSTSQLIPLNVDGNNSGDRSQELPGPEDFEIYEQYADETTALFQDTLEGSGEEIASGDKVAMSYRGWLTDGTLFDQSGRNEAGELEPFVFQLGANQVIPGWEQGIYGMKVGGKRRLVIPAVAAYGDTEKANIPPNSMLIFDVELLQAQKQTVNDQSGL